MKLNTSTTKALASQINPETWRPAMKGKIDNIINNNLQNMIDKVMKVIK